MALKRLMIAAGALFVLPLSTVAGSAGSIALAGVSLSDQTAALFGRALLLVKGGGGHGVGRAGHGGPHSLLGGLGSFEGHGLRKGSAQGRIGFAHRRFGRRGSKADGWQGYGWYDCDFVEAPTLAIALQSSCNSL